MYFTLLFTFLSTIIFCLDETTTMWKKIDKNTLDIKLAETDNKITVSIISKDYFPLIGSWSTGGTNIKSDQFIIDNLRLSKWVYMNITTKEKLNAFLQKSSKYCFKFITDKDDFVRKDNLECKLRLVKKEDFETSIDKFLDDYASLDFPDEESVICILSRRFKEMVGHEVIYGIKFNNSFDEMPNLKEYELGIYVPKVKNETQRNKETLMSESSLKKKIKQTAFEVGKHTLIGLGIFGPYAFFLVYAISKYLIK